MHGGGCRQTDAVGQRLDSYPETGGGPLVPDPVRPPAARRSGVSGFVWSAVSFGGSRLVVFVATLVLARVLVPEEFGLVAAAMVLVSYFEIGLDLGVGASLIYEQEEGISDRVHTAFTVNLLVCLALTAAGVAAAPAVAAFFQVPTEDALFRVVFAYLLIRGLGQIHDALLKRDLDFRRRTVTEITRAVIRAGVSIPLALAGLGAWALVWGLLAGEVGGTAANWWLVRFRPKLRLARPVVGSLLAYGLPVVGTKIVGWVGSTADDLVVGNLLGPRQLGFYTIAYRLPELLIANVLWLFSSVAFPVYSRARTEGGDAFRAAMLRALTLTTLFGFTVGTGLAIVARDAVLVLFSAQWAPATTPMVLLALATGLQSIGYASGDIFPAMGRPGLLLKLSAPMIVLLVIAFVVVGPAGLTAVAAVHLVFQVIFGMARLVVASRLLGAGIGDHLRAMWPAVCASLGIVLCALPVRLSTKPGIGSLLATVAAGTMGGAAALLLGARSALATLRDLAATLRAR